MDTVTSELQAQGDLIILPWPGDVGARRRMEDIARVKPLTVPVVTLTGNDGHDHTLRPAVGVGWLGYGSQSQTLGVLTVDEGAVAVLAHPEHGESLIGPGVYVVRRQREQADEIRLVAD